MDMAADTKSSEQSILSIAVAVLTVILRISQPSSTLSMDYDTIQGQSPMMMFFLTKIDWA